MKKKMIAFMMAAAIVLGLAACGAGTGDGSAYTGGECDDTNVGSAEAEGESADTSDGNGLKVTLVVADSFGDRSFYDSSKEGVDRLAAEKGASVSTIECRGENHATQMKNAADNKPDVVVCVGWEFYEIENVAPDYSDVKWIWIDNATEAPVDNILNITYAQNEGSFLAGYIAAAMTTSGTVGTVGGEDADTINDFIVGYEQGVEYYNQQKGTNVTTLRNYANSYTDPAIGKECANTLNDQGADVIFQIASATGDGVFESAKERGYYAIGVDSDQKYIDPDTIICSMKKEVGNSIYDAVSELMDGDDSRWGTTWVADMSNGYVGIGYGEDSAAQQIPDDVKAEVEELVRQITSGTIKVETTRS